MKDQALTLALQVLETYIKAVTLLDSNKDAKFQHDAHAILVKNMRMAIASASVIREILAIKTDDVDKSQMTSVKLSDSEVELLAVRHEDFGFGLVDNHGISTHGFSPEGLKAFVQEILYKAQTKHLCWCDLNNLGEPGVSCGDCPTRDYKRVDDPMPDSFTLPQFEPWADGTFGSEFKDTETLTYFRMSAAWNNAQQQLSVKYDELRKSLSLSREYGKKTLELALMWRRRWKELEEEFAIIRESEPVGHLYTIAGQQHCTIEKTLPDCALYATQVPYVKTQDKFTEDQWWVKEIDEGLKNGTPEQKRAVAVVYNLLKQLNTKESS